MFSFLNKCDLSFYLTIWEGGSIVFPMLEHSCNKWNLAN